MKQETWARKQLIKKLCPDYRPKRIILTFYDDFSGEWLGTLNHLYDPIKGLNGFYRKSAILYKETMAPIYRKVKMLEGNIITKVDLIPHKL